MTQQRLRLENAQLRASFCPETGALLQLEDRQRGFAHLVETGATLLSCFCAAAAC